MHSLVKTGIYLGQEGNVQRCLPGVAHTWVHFQFGRGDRDDGGARGDGDDGGAPCVRRDTLCPRAQESLCLPALLWQARWITWALWKLLSTQNKVKGPIPARCYFTKKEHCVSCSQFLAVYHVSLLVSLSVNTLINFITPACGQNITNGGSGWCVGTGISHLKWL